MFMNTYQTINITRFFDHKGNYHRDDGPAFITEQGDKIYYQHGKMHRDDGPAYEASDGYQEFWSNDNKHRLNGPAIIYLNGDTEWWVDGQLHREDGPAIETHSLKEYEFWIDGNNISFEEWCHVLEKTPEEISFIKLQYEFK